MFKKEKGYNYFEYFVKSADSACRAAEYLNESLSDFDMEKLPERVASMHEIENRADGEKHDMMRRLLHEFITPIEREDIVALAQQLDDVLDAIDDVMLRIDMFRVREIRSGALKFTSLLIKCCTELLGTLGEFADFKNSKKIRDSIVAVNSLESEGDRLHSDCVKELYGDDAIDAKTLLAWTQIYDELESCLDACEHCTDIIESVIMKNS